MGLFCRSRRKWDDGNKFELKVLMFKATDWINSLKLSGHYRYHDDEY